LSPPLCAVSGEEEEKEIKTKEQATGGLPIPIPGGKDL
jgi:hypothetical protein